MLVRITKIIALVSFVHFDHETFRGSLKLSMYPIFRLRVGDAINAVARYTKVNDN